jgi:hypothetical protein
MMGFRHARATDWAGALPNSLSPITAVTGGDVEPTDQIVFGSRQSRTRFDWCRDSMKTDSMNHDREEEMRSD